MSDKLVQTLRRKFAEGVHEEADQPGDRHVTVPAARLVEVLRFLKNHCGLEMLADVIGVDYPERERRFDVIYYLRSLARPQQLWVRVLVPEHEPVPSVSGLWRAADWHEREVYDLFGVPFSGHPDLRRILCHHEFEGHPLRKDYPAGLGQELSRPEVLFGEQDIARAARRADLEEDPEGGSDEVRPADLMTVNLDCGHPAMHGCLRVECLTDGETVIEARTEIGYVHRCFEKEAERRTWAGVMPYTDRLNYCSPMLNNVIYADAVEKLLRIQVPPRCRVIRVIVSELSRIIDHLVCVGGNLAGMGATTMYSYTVHVREAFSGIIERLCGSRLTASYARIGGLSHDLYDGFEDEVRAKLRMLEGAVDELIRLALRNRIFLERTVGVGVIGRDDAISHGFTGPCLRASGVPYDVRKAHPTIDYQEYDFDVPTGEDGDTHARIMVRMAEIVQSTRIVEQALHRLPDGPIHADEHRVVLPSKEMARGTIEGAMNHCKLICDGIRVPAGAAYGFGEGSNGELGFYCLSDGSGRPYRIKVRPPCFPIFGAYAGMIEGRALGDAAVILGSLNIIAGEMDR